MPPPPATRADRPRRPCAHVATAAAVAALVLGCTVPAALEPTASAPPAREGVAASERTDDIPPAPAEGGPTPSDPVLGAGAVPTAAAGARPVVVGTFDVAVAPEASGIAVGRRDPTVRWVVDDGPGTTSVVALAADGTLLGRVEMAGVDGRDVEDLAIGPCGAADPTPCLYVGDVGDNDGERPSVQVHRFPEPVAADGSVEVVTATLTHPADPGPTDVEGLVVDDAGVPVLLTKEIGRTRLLSPAAFADGPLAEIAVLTLPEPARPMLTRFAGLSVTAADRGPDGWTLLLRTYDSVIELTAPTAGASLAGVADWAVAELPAPPEPQGEAIAALPGGGYVTVSEGTGQLWGLPEA